mmetsp:Transcript_98943/g.295516  ORF Transcript_98943/g.295516 Transcript_98943/m.295516 type:complete len:229 (+) Transcript_98943:273-959(+)
MLPPPGKCLAGDLRFPRQLPQPRGCGQEAQAVVKPVGLHEGVEHLLLVAQSELHEAKVDEQLCGDGRVHARRRALEDALGSREDVHGPVQLAHLHPRDPNVPQEQGAAWGVQHPELLVQLPGLFEDAQSTFSISAQAHHVPQAAQEARAVGRLQRARSDADLPRLAEGLQRFPFVALVRKHKADASEQSSSVRRLQHPHPLLDALRLPVLLQRSLHVTHGALRHAHAA